MAPWDPARRQRLRQLFGVAALLGSGGVSRLLAASAQLAPPGVQSLKGSAWCNGQPLAMGKVVVAGDRITTGAASELVVVVEQNGYLLRDQSELVLTPRPNEALGVDLKQGKLLAVFGKGPRTVTTPQAVVGVRGTGLYLESEAQSSYLCLCYGTASLHATAQPTVQESITTHHHESPRYLREEADGWQIRPAPMLNHTDAELVMLEALLGRTPPFVGFNFPGSRYESDRY